MLAARALLDLHLRKPIHASRSRANQRPTPRSQPKIRAPIVMKKLILFGTLAAAGTIGLQSVSSAHGGPYRGPGDTVPAGGGGGGGGGATPTGPGASGPSTGGPAGPSTPS